MKKPCFFSIADTKNLPYYKMMSNSLKKFHPDIPLFLYGEKEIKETGDPQIFYRATPYFAKKLWEQGYDWICKLDADQIVLGDLNFIMNVGDYQVGTVLNVNRVDPQKYGFVEGWGIPPNEYYNCGLVVMTDKGFIDRFYDLCYSKYFNRFKYFEQDILNILCHYGGYRVRCFDHYDVKNNYCALHGLVAKGETIKAVLRGKEIIIPRGKDNYPSRDSVLKVIHWAGGQGEVKMNYKIWFSQEVQNYIDTLVI